MPREAISFDAVLLLEVVEHVPDVPALIKAIAPLVKPRGIMILSTLNRTLKAFALAIVGGEYILRWLPVGTHQWDRFVTPDELRSALSGAGLKLTDTTGMMYDPFADQWRLGRDTDVNYFATAIADLGGGAGAAAPHRGWHADHLLEGAAERGFGIVADLVGDGGDVGAAFGE